MSTSIMKQGMGKSEKEPMNNKVTTMLKNIMKQHTIQKIEKYLQIDGGNLIACEIF